MRIIANFYNLKHISKLNLIICSFFIILILFSVNTSVYADKLNWEEIRNNSQNLVKKEPDNVIAKLKLTVSLANTGKIKEAYNLIKKLGDEVSEKEFNKKLKPYLKKLKKEPDNVLLLNYAAFNKVIADDYNQAIDYFLHIKELEPNNIWIQNFLAASYNEIKDYQKAEDLLHHTLEIQDNQYSHLLLGISHYKRGHIFRALKELAQAGELVDEIVNGDY